MAFPTATDLVGAVERGELEAYFQPQLDIASNEIVAVEALARWNHPTLGLVSPVVFIPLAEESGIIHEFGTFMVMEGCRRAAEWAAAGRHIEVAVNVSAAQLAEEMYAAELIAAVETVGLPPRTLTIEITESLPILDVPQVVARLDVMRSYGIGVSVDDFGVGHSSLSRVDSIPATELKIDLSYVQDQDAGARKELEDIVALARVRGLRIVAEGVETDEQLERVRELGCDRAQGFLIGRPVPFDQLAF